MDNELIEIGEKLACALQAKNMTLAVAESCTGGGICHFLTGFVGSSNWFDCGFITYSNQAKIKMLGVKPETLEKFGAVSEQTALEMTNGALKNSSADYAVSVTGIAGPDGGSIAKPIGTVFIAVQNHKNSICYEKHFNGTRHEVRQQSIKFALEALLIRVLDR